MRERIHDFLTKPIVIALVILISAVLTHFTGGLGYFFGMIAALMVLWSGRFKWIEFGISRPRWIKSILVAIALAISIFIIVDILIQPLIELKFGAIDLSSFDGIRGNYINFLVFILFMWVVAGIGEEFLYRGFFMKQFARILGDTNKGWLFSAIAMSILFGMAHLYQGMSGMISTGLVSLCLSLIFYKNRNNLILNMFVHGFYDMIGISLIFINKERIFTDWIQAFLIQ
ncbi:MAG TPA: type II CAAX endopeptidase family protein [Bacteroidales bacterium]|nr:type II CAAX endopeptidase family protein [Bacteroidales bacterium]HPT01914.1 type II CAAX endopeptidase family protein [Bacteroidales bacterium]